MGTSLFNESTKVQKPIRSPLTLSRRQWLISTGTAAACAVAAPLKAADEARLAIIDCHAHIYSEDDKTYPVIEKPYRPPVGKGTVAHLGQEMKAAGVHKTVAIHTFTFYGFDNRFTADACRDHRDVITGVCLLNPEDPKSSQVLEQYVKDFNIRGLRFINNQKTGRLDEPGNNALLSTCERLGIAACALTNRDSRSQLEALAARYPKLPLVIDHCLNLAAGKQYDAILADMLALAKLPNLHAKLSYVVTGSAEEYPFRDMHDSCRQIIRAFGPDRCVWGSDFPCELWCPKASYSQHVRVFTHELGLDDETKRQILCEIPRLLWFS
jgi:predicted TIM-barrel fold metal-dependent hydrolase